MYQIIHFLFRFRAFLLFLLLEVTGIVLVYQNNSYQRAGFLNSSNWITGNVLSAADYVFEFVSMRQANRVLLEENARLKEQLANSAFEGNGTYSNGKTYAYIEAGVINNSIRNFNNFITINKGSSSGIRSGMGVVSSNGVVGKVKDLSENFSVVYSVLHSDIMISSQIASSGEICTVKWDGADPLTAKVLYIPRHLKPVEGEKIVTSGYNAVFPPGVLVGTIEKIELSDDSMFYDVTLRLATNFGSISHVYVINNKYKDEIDSLQYSTGPG